MENPHKDACVCVCGGCTYILCWPVFPLVTLVLLPLIKSMQFGQIGGFKQRILCDYLFPVMDLHPIQGLLCAFWEILQDNHSPPMDCKVMENGWIDHL